MNGGVTGSMQGAMSGGVHGNASNCYDPYGTETERQASLIAALQYLAKVYKIVIHCSEIIMLHSTAYIRAPSLAC